MARPRHLVDNEIYMVEREISECNDKYNKLMSKSNPASATGNAGEKALDLMKQLEGKTEALRRLKRERDELVEFESKMVAPLEQIPRMHKFY